MALFRFCEIGESDRSDRPYNMRDTHSLKWMTDRRDLTVPDFWILIAATDASFFGHFRRSGIGAVAIPKMK